MIIQKYNNEEEWLEGRKGKITGSSVGGIVVNLELSKTEITDALNALEIEYNTKAKKEELERLLPKDTIDRIKQANIKTKEKKIGYYKVLAERVAIPANGENVMDRGHRLELDAIEKFTKETGKVVNIDLVIWFREDNTDIAISPDGYIEEKKKVTEAVEVKCLASERHIEAYLTQTIPDEYNPQKIQYFAVNEDLETLYWVFFDPRCPIDMFYLVFTRKELQAEITEYLMAEQITLSQLAEDEKKLTIL